MLEEADRCQPREIGALLHREGLYSSHLTTGRCQREAGTLAALAPVERGPKALAVDAQGQRVVALQREVERLRQRLVQADTIIEVQKKSPCCWGSTRAQRRAATSLDGYRRDLGAHVGMVRACRSLGVARATLYYQRARTAASATEAARVSMNRFMGSVAPGVIGRQAAHR